jgi:VIT1/CCC1 family predicted Fe2+/Mn2+ transporter
MIMFLSFFSGNHQHQKERGLSFGSTSAVITTLGMIIGINSATSSTLAVMASIITLAIADSLSDAMGIHVSEEFEGVHSEKEIWLTTFYAFLGKFFFTITFIVPFLILKNHFYAIWVSVVWGLGVLSFLSYSMAKKHNVPAYKVILEHDLITIFVIFATYFVGSWLSRFA